MSFPLALSAASIEASGQAIIYNSDIEDARYRATEQAIKQAVLQSSALLMSHDKLDNGQLSSSMHLQASGYAESTKILSEVISDNILKVRISTDITDEMQCRNGATNLYKKSVGITGFALQTPQQASLGALHNIPRAFPKSLTNEINRQGYLHALAATNIRIYPDLINAPTSTNVDGSLTDVARIGEDLGVQYVISGVIRDIDEVNPKHPDEDTPLNSLLKWANKETNERNMMLDIYIYDGFSGALLFEESYQESGDWTPDRNKKMGFGSSAFWKTSYGHIVQQVLWQISLDASEKLRCQPFVANIFRTEGNKIHINAGSLSGIKKGDKFNVYRRYEIFDQLQNAQTQLNNANINVTITQVQPNFAIGELAVDARILNVQQQDVVIAW
ncbi:flagellar assembly protein FlgT [Marinomonas sp. 15G1-11]|uniref:Flagellar assembly protein FlgT n=1 Tax=Marinomonas phaeophyticola TaxID=3004091 RepID=A0ABT4JUR7_9GAMM|nr:flagellar assembly protein FlgT [Marinomonas sp. 15G1-11]MCZ2722138.1 flagellar assembly protein FlgT [Marinomonas sp. 15G1-11]